jgi:hypothetical protein
MIGSVVVFSTLFLSQTPSSAQSKDWQQPAPKPEANTKAAVAADPAQALAEYNALKEKAPATAAGQWKLGLWCEEHGLKPEAYVHFSEVVRLDPRRDAAWRKLGFKKYHGRWTTDAEIAEENEQKKADKLWVPRLKRIHKDIHGRHGAKVRASAEAALLAIKDPRAILSLYREFGGSKLDQSILIGALGRIDRPLSSKVLAILAIYGKTREVRQQAIAVLRDRPADDFLDVMVGMMTDPLKYEVRRVGGPGSPGVIFVEGERFNIARYYAPPPAPNIAPAPGDIITFDASGEPIINRPVMTLPLSDINKGIPGSKTLVRETTTTDIIYAQISVQQLKAEAERAAQSAEAQLEVDVAKIEAMNKDRNQFNNLVIAAAKEATGKDLGKTPKDWRDALGGRNKLSTKTDPTPSKPTIPEAVPLAYNPTFAPVGLSMQILKQTRVYEDS